MLVRAFGPFTVHSRLGDPAEPLARPKERALGAALALTVGREVTTTDLVDALWAGSPPISERKALQTHVLRLREQLDPGTIVTTPGGYRLQIDADDVDVHRFEHLARAHLVVAPGSDDPASLRRVLDLWTGEPFADLAGWPPAVRAREQLAEQHAQLVERLTAVEVRAGEASLAHLEHLVAERPLREHRWVLLIAALASAGRRADALRAYERARQMLAAELGIEPGPELAEVERAVLDGVDPSGSLWLPSSPPGTDIVERARRSARDAAAAGDHDGAAAHLDKALLAADAAQVDHRVLVDLALERAEVAWARGEPDVAVGTALEAARLARSARDAPRLARAALAAAGNGWQSGLDPGSHPIELLDEALAALRPGPTALRSMVLARVAVAESHSRPLALALSHCDEALVLARMLDEPSCLAVALHARLSVDQDLASLDAREALAHELLALGHDRDEPLWDGWALPHLALIFMAGGRHDAAVEAMARLAEIAELTRSPALQYISSAGAITEPLMAADFDAARRVARNTRSFGEQVLPDPTAAALAEGGQLGIADLLEGVVAHVEVIEITYPQPTIDALARSWTAAGLLQLGDVDGARRSIEHLDAPALRALPHDAYWPSVVAFLSAALRGIADADRAAVVYDMAAPFEHLYLLDGAGLFLGAAHRHLQVLAEACGRDDVAGRHAEQAAAAHRRIGASSWWDGCDVAVSRARRSADDLHR